MVEWIRDAGGVYAASLDGVALSVDRLGRDWYWTAYRKGCPSARGNAATLTAAKAAAEAAAIPLRAG